MNQLQEQLRTIETSIIILKKQPKPNNEKIEALRHERDRILHELGDTLQ